MDSRTDELEDFKTRVNLTEFAAAHGYALDRKASSRSSAVMVNVAGDKLIVAVGDDGHWVYFSVFNPTDNGTIIDFVQRRQGGTLGQVRRTLRPWLGSSGAVADPRVDPARYSSILSRVSRDLLSVRARFEGMAPISPTNQYLVGTRRIPAWLLGLPAVAETIRVDERGNVCFAHHNEDGLCGYEIKNAGFTGFASGGIKGLWSVSVEAPVRVLVASETALDGLSYLALRGGRETRVVSIAGQPNRQQPELLRRAMQEMPSGGRVVSAMDRDAGGDSLTEQISSIFAAMNRDDLDFVDDRPSTSGADWNDELRGLSLSGLRPAP